MRAHDDVRGGGTTNEPSGNSAGGEAEEGRTLVVAVSGRETSLAPLRAAAAIARRRGTTVEMVVVFEPRFPLPRRVGEDTAPRLDDPLQRRQAQWLVERARAERHQVATDYPEADEWTIHLEVGDAPTKIARAARQARAWLVVVGLGRAGDPTTGQLARRLMYLSDLPLLGVAADGPTEFTSILVDGGFSGAGLRVARAAMRILTPGGELHLVSVSTRAGKLAPGMVPADGPPAAGDPDALRRQLDAPPEVVVRTARLDGDPAAQLLSYAEQLRIPLVATAIEGRTATERTLLRNLGPSLLRARRGAVLLVPPVATREPALPEPQLAAPAGI
ncbi:MAG: universal stress protein [Gemmatimonadaceae bacterium]